MPSKRCWRIVPDPHVERGVEDFARREGRSLSSMMNRLLAEAITERAISCGKTQQIFDQLVEQGAISRLERARLLGAMTGTNGPDGHASP